MAIANTIQNPTATSLRAKYSLTASLAAQSVLNGTNAVWLQSQTDTTGVNQISVPPNQIWHFVDAWVNAALSVDLIIDVLVTGTAQNINMDTAVMVASGGNTSRVNPFDVMQGLTIPANASLQTQAVTQSANGTSAATEYVSFKVFQEPIGNLAVPVTKGISG